MLTIFAFFTGQAVAESALICIYPLVLVIFHLLLAEIRKAFCLLRVGDCHGAAEEMVWYGIGLMKVERERICAV